MLWQSTQTHTMCESAHRGQNVHQSAGWMATKMALCECVVVVKDRGGQQASPAVPCQSFMTSHSGKTEESKVERCERRGTDYVSEFIPFVWWKISQGGAKRLWKTYKKVLSLFACACVHVCMCTAETPQSEFSISHPEQVTKITTFHFNASRPPLASAPCFLTSLSHPQLSLCLSTWLAILSHVPEDGRLCSSLAGCQGSAGELGTYSDWNRSETEHWGRGGGFWNPVSSPRWSRGRSSLAQNLKGIV